MNIALLRNSYIYIYIIYNPVYMYICICICIYNASGACTDVCGHLAIETVWRHSRSANACLCSGCWIHSSDGEGAWGRGRVISVAEGVSWTTAADVYRAIRFTALVHLRSLAPMAAAAGLLRCLDHGRLLKSLLSGTLDATLERKRLATSATDSCQITCLSCRRISSPSPVERSSIVYCTIYMQWCSQCRPFTK